MSENVDKWDWTAEQDAAMWAEVAKAEEKASLNLNGLYHRIKELRGKKFHDLLLEYMDEMHFQGDNHGHEIVEMNAPNRKPQRIETPYKKRRLNTEYVNQYCNGGMEGDSFAGQIWLHIKGRRYFTFHYSM